MGGSVEVLARKVFAVLVVLLGIVWLLGFYMLPKESHALSVSDYFFGMFFLIPLTTGILLYPRTDEQTKQQAYWFTIVCGILATPVVLMLSFAVLSTNLHLK